MAARYRGTAARTGAASLGVAVGTLAWVIGQPVPQLVGARPMPATPPPAWAQPLSAELAHARAELSRTEDALTAVTRSLAVVAKAEGAAGAAAAPAPTTFGPLQALPALPPPVHTTTGASAPP
ncbi:MAG: hypothetical protein ACYDAQ_19945 [Mycobacteriales bacterium]